MKQAKAARVRVRVRQAIGGRSLGVLCREGEEN
jgi:hypothetical protein